MSNARAARYRRLALAQRDQGAAAFREAKKRGLDEKTVHPTDRPLLAQFDAKQ